MTNADTARIGRRIWSIYGFAVVMALVAIVPGCNFAYSGHGGPAWFLVPFVLPYALGRLLWQYFKAEKARRREVARFAFVSLLLYAPISFAASFLGAKSIESSFGLPLDPLFFWGMFTLPFGFPLARGFFAL